MIWTDELHHGSETRKYTSPVKVYLCTIYEMRAFSALEDKLVREQWSDLQEPKDLGPVCAAQPGGPWLWSTAGLEGNQGKEMDLSLSSPKASWEERRGCPSAVGNREVRYPSGTVDCGREKNFAVCRVWVNFASWQTAFLGKGMGECHLAVWMPQPREVFPQQKFAIRKGPSTHLHCQVQTTCATGNVQLSSQCLTLPAHRHLRGTVNLWEKKNHTSFYRDDVTCIPRNSG